MSPRIAVVFKEENTAVREEPVLRIVEAPKRPAKPVKSAETIARQQELAVQFRVDAKRIARSLIRKWRCRIEVEELDSVVDLALCEAASSFDPSRGTRFITLLYYHLKGRLIQTISARAHAAAHLTRNTLSISTSEASSQPDTASAILEQKTFVCNRPLPDEQILRRDIVARCLEACDRLRGLEREVIMRIYFQNQDMSEVTEALGYSRSHLSRIRIRALKKLQGALGLPITADVSS